MQLDDFNFVLPKELIARYPTKRRSASRLLYLPKDHGKVSHHRFDEITQFLEAGDLLVFNDTKVIPARLFGHKKTGGRVEILVERILDDRHILAQLKSSKPPKSADDIVCEHGVCFTILDKKDHFYHLRCNNQQHILSIIEAIGHIPLPPYMAREAEPDDALRYQTVYAKHKGSVAGPTAGFHFDQELLKTLEAKKVQFGYLTLHIGAGTFMPVRTADIREHRLHTEYFEVGEDLVQQIKSTKAANKRVIAVGTTTLRALESASQEQLGPYAGETNIFIFPGYQFKCVDVLITNLHLPCSTLLMLVCAFGGYEQVMAAYQSAVKHKYRFYSYGDAMLVTKQSPGKITK